MAVKVQNLSVAIIGGGVMGVGLGRRLIDSKIVSSQRLKVIVRRPQQAAKLRQQWQLNATVDRHKALKNSAAIFVCVKPQDCNQVLEQIKKDQALKHNPLLISIVTGASIASIQRSLGERAHIVRAVPNTPGLIGAGITVCSFSNKVTAKEKQLTQRLFAAFGDYLELEEDHMDTITGLSASGPAFVYVMIEALADGGVMRGLPRKVALRLAAQTLLGGARTLLETGRHPADLKDDVTTPAGCTIGALLHLEDGRIRSVLARGVEEAARIASSLAPEEKPGRKEVRP